jgi:hypothetical protein
MKLDFLTRKADYVGITGSLLCLVHCIATPMLLMSSRLLQTNDHIRVGYLSLDYVFIAVNIAAVYFATRHYASAAVRRSLWGFLCLFTASVLLEDVNEVFEYISYVASAGLMLTHLVNIRQHRLQHAH